MPHLPAVRCHSDCTQSHSCTGTINRPIFPPPPPPSSSPPPPPPLPPSFPLPPPPPPLFLFYYIPDSCRFSCTCHMQSDIPALLPSSLTALSRAVETRTLTVEDKHRPQAFYLCTPLPWDSRVLLCDGHTAHNPRNQVEPWLHRQWGEVTCMVNSVPCEGGRDGGRGREREGGEGGRGRGREERE